ncbi:MAG: hypothetical protein IPJ21_00730 [Sterolibacteriaceae bacterium]|nr:hypothetical protein [Sterolibacteriaceae bacterium]MBK9086187.1 hypothetical protein [Sterolibacteriaceae bacterium]
MQSPGALRFAHCTLPRCVADRVEELTRGRQTPVTPGVLVTVPDFVLAETGR